METKLSSWKQSASIREVSDYVPVLAVQNVKQEKENWGNVAPIGPKAPFILNMEKNRSKTFFFFFFAIFSMALI